MFRKSRLAGPILLCLAAPAGAVPVLQVGAPAGPGDQGVYADYDGSLVDPTEEDTAVTGGATLYVGGVYRPNVDLLGGQYDGGPDWTGFGYPGEFAGKGALLTVTVPDGSGASADAGLRVSVDGAGAVGAFYWSPTLDGLYPNNHDPLKDAVGDFLFFDLGDFDNVADQVPDFYEPNYPNPETKASGEIKTLTVSGFGALPWVHFDVQALETNADETGTVIKSSALDCCPGSHDVTWKPVSEPPLLALIVPGLVALVGVARRRRRLPG